MCEPKGSWTSSNENEKHQIIMQTKQCKHLGMELEVHKIIDKIKIFVLTAALRPAAVVPAPP